MGLFQILTTVIKTGSKELAKRPPNQWKYDLLNAPMKENVKLFQVQNYPYLRSPEELWPLVNGAIKNHSKENALKIIQHLKTYGTYDSKSQYGIIIKAVKKAFKEIDITDLL